MDITPGSCCSLDTREELCLHDVCQGHKLMQFKLCSAVCPTMKTSLASLVQGSDLQAEVQTHNVGSVQMAQQKRLVGSTLLQGGSKHQAL